MTYSIKSKQNFRNWSVSGHVRWRSTPPNPDPLQKVFFQFNEITFSSLRLQDLGSNFSKFSCRGMLPKPPSSLAGILGSIADPCDLLPARSDEFQKVCDDISNTNIQPEQFSSSDHDGFLGERKCNTGIKINFYRLVANWATRETK
jgi:hypothetical protein